MKAIRKSVFFLFCTVFLCARAFSFEWPVENITADSFSSYFAQNRGKKISSSIVFKEKSEVKTVENARILMVIADGAEDDFFFPNTLGSSVIEAHKDGLISVYGNLQTEDALHFLRLAEDNSEIPSGTVIGESGERAWQESKNGLEFQIIDTKKSAAINPKIILSRTDAEMQLRLSGILIENKNKEKFDIRTYKTFPAGTYRIYFSKNQIAVPYKTEVFLNGETADQIGYDTVNQENSRLYVNGKKKYISTDIYPDGTNQLLGEAILTPGKVTLGLTISPLQGTPRHADYILTVY